MLEAFFASLHNFSSPDIWIYSLVGAMIGLIVGIMPGIGSMLAYSLAMPFIFRMTPMQALPLLVGISSATATGGCITAVLLNIPGEGANTATLLDGHPMAQKGEAGRALGAGLMASLVGGFLSVILALLMLPLMLYIVMAVGSAEMVFLILMGLAFIAVLGSGNMLKSLISGFLGILISFVGIQNVTGVPRFTFGSMYLYDGIGLIALTMGLFAIPEVIDLTRGGTIAKSPVVNTGMRAVLEGGQDVFRHRALTLRSAVMGFIVGVIPGLGAMVASFFAYGQAKATSKHPEKFGTGTVEGVVAPETANNAKEGGALLTTLALGVPGSAEMVLYLAAMMLVGLVPGPEMVTRHLDLSVTLILVIATAGTIAAIVCLLAAPHLAKVATIPSRILVPLIVVIIFIGTFAFAERIYDIVMLLVFGLIGLVMARFGLNRITFLLGYILGPLFEQNVFLATQANGLLFFLSPISLSLIFVIIVLFGFKPVRKALRRRKGFSGA
ncbi:MAG: tripartite tricarboxylate transporter permease [Chloroflexi bacterium]|nr:tripartite tricarboxylate transporter permease [Chloroflexota bacterium]